MFQFLFSKYTFLWSSASFLFISDVINNAQLIEKLGIVGLLAVAIIWFARKDAQKQKNFETELAELKAGTKELLAEKDKTFEAQLKDKDVQIAKLEARIFDLENPKKRVSTSRKPKNID